MSAIAEIVQRYIKKTTAVLGVGFKNLNTGESYFHNRDMRFPSASIALL